MSQQEGTSQDSSPATLSALPNPHPPPPVPAPKARARSRSSRLTLSLPGPALTHRQDSTAPRRAQGPATPGIAQHLQAGGRRVHQQHPAPQPALEGQPRGGARQPGVPEAARVGSSEGAEHSAPARLLRTLRLLLCLQPAQHQRQGTWRQLHGPGHAASAARARSFGALVAAVCGRDRLTVRGAGCRGNGAPGGGVDLSAGQGVGRDVPVAWGRPLLSPERRPIGVSKCLIPRSFSTPQPNPPTPTPGDSPLPCFPATRAPLPPWAVTGAKPDRWAGGAHSSRGIKLPPTAARTAGQGSAEPGGLGRPPWPWLWDRPQEDATRGGLPRVRS